MIVLYYSYTLMSLLHRMRKVLNFHIVVLGCFEYCSDSWNGCKKYTTAIQATSLILVHITCCVLYEVVEVCSGVVQLVSVARASIDHVGAVAG